MILLPFNLDCNSSTALILYSASVEIHYAKNENSRAEFSSANSSVHLD